MIVLLAALTAAPAASVPGRAQGQGNVAFCFVRDAPHHDYLTPPAPAGTDLRAKMEEWLAARLPALAAAGRARSVQCDPDVPRTVYDRWFGRTRLSSGEMISERLDWPADWYLRRPPRRDGRRR